jgi:hypothetical protein
MMRRIFLGDREHEVIARTAHALGTRLNTSKLFSAKMTLTRHVASPDGDALMEHLKHNCKHHLELQEHQEQYWQIHLIT